MSRFSLSVGDAFACGMVYTALSRASSLDGLYLTGPLITQTSVKADPDVIEYYRRFASMEKRRLPDSMSYTKSEFIEFF